MAKVSSLLPIASSLRKLIVQHCPLQARSSLTFKGPANEKRVRKPPALHKALVKPLITQTKKSIEKVSKSAQVEDDDADSERGEMSEKQKGKRRAFDVEAAESRGETSRRGEFSISRSLLRIAYS